MTRFLDTSAVSRLIGDIGLENVLAQMAAYIDADYKDWQNINKVERLVNHSALGVNELMPAANKSLYGFKYVNGHPANTAKGLLTIVAFGMLATIETGYPILLTEMTLLTALRTAAMSALVAKYTARKDSRSMAIIGCGAQSEFQILAFKAMLGIKEVHIYDVDATAMEKLRHNMEAYEGLKIIPATSVREAVQGVDIVTTVTADKTRATILTRDMVHAGMHINGVGGDCPGKTELHPDILKDARVIVEYEPQTRIEGDIQQMPADFPVTEFWRVATGGEQGRHSDEQITVFDSVGFGLQDFSALRYFNDVAVQKNAGTMIDLVPTLPNPKDLYSMLQTVKMPMMPQVKMAEAVERKEK